MGAQWNWVIPRIRSNNIFNWSITVIHIHDYWGCTIRFYARIRLLLSNTRFNSFVDIANEYLDPLVALSLAGLTGYVGLYQVCQT